MLELDIVGSGCILLSNLFDCSLILLRGILPFWVESLKSPSYVSAIGFLAFFGYLVSALSLFCILVVGFGFGLKMH